MGRVEAGPGTRSWDRLTRGVDIRRATSRGIRRSGTLMVLYVAPGEALRAGFVGTRRVGGAVARNRARRLMREAWRAVVGRVAGSHDVVVMARPGIRSAGMREVLDEMTMLLEQAGVLLP